MAKFRNGNLVLTNTQSIIHGSTTIVDDTRKALFNSLQLDASLTNITELSTDGTFTADSDAKLPTEKAIKYYVDNAVLPYESNKIYQGDSSVEVIDVAGAKIEFKTDNALRWKVTPNGKLLNYDLTEGLSINSVSYALQLLGSSAGPASHLLGRFSNDASEPTIKFIKSRSTTIGSYTTVQVADNLGSIYWNADDGTSYDNVTARILAEAEGSISTGIVPGRLAFYTADSAGVSTLRLRLRYNGQAEISGILGITGTTKTDGYFYAGSSDPDNTTRLNYDGYFYATRVYNAVWNDIADFQDLADNLVPGKCYFDAVEGARICDLRCQRAVIGIASDTYGHGVGQITGKKQVPIAVCGWVLAYVDGQCEMGDALTNNHSGNLIKMTDEEKCKYPERIVATYKKKESSEYFGPNKEVKVNGRHWVKVK